MEIGSFLELDLKRTGEYFKTDSKDIARLNSGRSAILHSIRHLNCSSVYIPLYLCPEVKQFLVSKGINVHYYSISDDFAPLMGRNENDTAMLIVNHYGLLGGNKLLSLKEEYVNVIIDNCSAFFAPALPGCLCVFSCRKFFGVPDGSYAIGHNASSGCDSYPLDESADTSSFLFKRIEKGCSLVYEERMLNEERINKSDIRQMSLLTQSLMNSLDYEWIRNRRIENFNYATELFREKNLLNIDYHIEKESIPLFYPLVLKNRETVGELQKKGIYTGRRWNSVLSSASSDSFEYFLSEYMVPIPVDQRYGRSEILYIYNCISDIMGS